MQQHASCRGNISVSPPLLGVFMTGLGMKKEAHSTLLNPHHHHHHHPPPPDCVQME